MKIEQRDIDKIIPYENNPRNNDNAVEKTAMSIREYGWQQPIVVDSDGVIVAGHTRLKAAKKLKYKVCPVLVADDLTPAQIKAYRIMDNKSGEMSEWDMDLLQAEIEDLMDLDFDVELTGFDDFDFGDSEELGNISSRGERGGHYNDEDAREPETLKLAYRIESFLSIKRNKAIELFSGQGSLTSWYNRNFVEVISNDKQVFDNITHSYNLTASGFIKNELKNHLDFDLIDFDDEGCPAKEIQEFFKVIKDKKEPFILAITDGQGLNLKCKGKINFKKTYMIRDDVTVQATTEDYYNFHVIFREFIQKVTEGFSCKELSLYLKDNGNVIYSTYLLKKV